MSAVEETPPPCVIVPPGGGHNFWVYGDQDNIKLTSRETGGSLMVMETTVHPHEGPPLHIHRNEDEAFYVVDGEMKVVDNGQESIVGTGALVFMPRNSVHRFENVRETPSVILVMFIPGGFEGYLMEMGTPLVEGQPRPEGPVDYDKVARVAPKYGLEMAHLPPTH